MYAKELWARPQHRARNAVDAEAEEGAGKLAAFLEDWPDIVREKYVLLLERALERHPNNNALFKVIFRCIEDSQHFKSTSPSWDNERWSIQNVREVRETCRKSGDWAGPCITYYDIFVSSIERWNRLDGRQTDPIYECPVITKKILDHAPDALWQGGAIHACAEYGLSRLLLHIVHEVMPTDEGSITKQLQIAFLSGPDSRETSLGIAIKKQIAVSAGAYCVPISPVTGRQYLACIGYLLGMRLEAEQYIVEPENAILTERAYGKPIEPILHTTLRWAYEAMGMAKPGQQSLNDYYDRITSLLNTITRAQRSLLAQRDSGGIPPYQYMLSQQSCFKGTRIEDFLRTEIFKLGDPDLVARALYDEKGKEIGLDFADFNHPTHRFQDFVDRLVNLESTEEEDLSDANKEDRGNGLQFEDTLIYLNLPALHGHAQPEAVDRFLSWLSRRGVERIKSLKLPDGGSVYTIHFVVNNILKVFKVDGLDWVCLHLNLPLFAETCMSLENPLDPPAQFQVYHYLECLPCSSPGKPGDRHIKWLKKIETLCATPVEMDAPDGFAQNLIPLDLDMKKTWRPFKAVEQPISEAEYSSEPQTFHQPTSQPISSLREELKQCHTFLSVLRRWGSKTCQDPRTKHCIEVMKSKQIKVALIDNGVDRMSSLIWKNIATGASFVRAGGRTEVPALPWYTAADAHGTQMACLIQETNPYCCLYPARVGSLQADIDDEAAAKAIEWAIRNDVDIISISWVFRQKSEALERAIREAVKRRILIFCTTPDTGPRPGPSIFPANYEDVITVSAVDCYGGVRPESCHDVHLMLGGERVPAKGPYFIQQYTRSLNGSSVATALAAGLASLCLFLARMANVDGTGDHFKDRLHMLALFRCMQMNSRDRVLLPSLLFGEDFACSDAFTNGTAVPPAGLRHFKWTTMDVRLQSSRNTPFNGTVPRRDLSRIRHAEGGAR